MAPLPLEAWLIMISTILTVANLGQTLPPNGSFGGGSLLLVSFSFPNKEDVMARRNSTVLACYILASVCVCCFGIDQGEQPESHVHDRFKAMYDRLQPLHVYGKVIDQSGTGVDGTDVRVVWYTGRSLLGGGDERIETVIRSDSNGLWDFHADKPLRAFVSDAKKDGYECVSIEDADSNLLAPRLTKTNPVIVRLRKKGEETFLIVIPAINRENELIRVASPNSRTNGLDVFAQKARRASAGKYTDLIVAADFEPASGWWRVTYSATNGTDGIVVGSDLQYEAPKEGYQKAVVLAGPPYPRYLYLKSRAPVIYTRLDLDHNVWEGAATNRLLTINYKAWINPYGDRNLEYDRRVEQNWRVEEELTADAKQALEARRLPAKPDIGQRIKATNERVAKEKEERLQKRKVK